MTQHTAQHTAQYATPPSAPPDGATDNAAVIRQLYDAVNAKNLAYLRALGSEASEWLDVPCATTSTGTEAILGPWQAWFAIFPDATCEVRSLAALGDHVVAQGVGRGTHRGLFRPPAGDLPATGRRMEVQFCAVPAGGPSPSHRAAAAEDAP